MSEGFALEAIRARIDGRIVAARREAAPAA
jgi:hypothetical protein